MRYNMIMVENRHL